MKLAKMGNCIRKHKDSDNEIILSIFGLDDAGKSTATKVLIGDKDLSDIAPTTGYEPHKLNYKSFNLTINDLGGGERVRDLWKHYMAESYGFIYALDSSNRKRIEESKKEFMNFINNPKVSGKPVLILGNKQDKLNALDESEIVEALNIEDIANKTKTPCRVETCALVSLNSKKIDRSLQSGFDWLIKYIEINYNDLRQRTSEEINAQRFREKEEMDKKKRKIEEKRRLENRSREFEEDDTDYTQIKGDPFKPLSDRFKDTDKPLKSTSLSTHDKQMNNYDMRTASPRPRLTTIDEEKAKFKNKFTPKNKLAPFDDGSDIDLYSKNPKTNPSSWAITGNTAGMSKRNALAPF